MTKTKRQETPKRARARRRSDSRKAAFLDAVSASLLFPSTIIVTHPESSVGRSEVRGLRNDRLVETRFPAADRCANKPRHGEISKERTTRAP